jgi:hypothetical protein
LPGNNLAKGEVRFGWLIRVNPEEYRLMMREQIQRVQARPGWEAALHAAAATLEGVVHPAACWKRTRVRAALHDKLVLEDGSRLGCAQLQSVMGGAEEVILAVCTLGPGVDRAVETTHREGKFMQALLLHDLASMAVDDLRQQVCHTLEMQLREEDLFVSAPLSPGEASWNIADQALIFSLLDTTPIGVTLNDSCLMSPLMSLSLVIGVSPVPFTHQEADSCLFCTLRERCNYRRLRAQAAT